MSPSFPAAAPRAEASSSPDPRANFRTKTVGTRMTPEEVREVEEAAKRAGKTLAEWVREVALREARPSPDVNELILGELAATRYMLLNLFQSQAQAGLEGKPFPPEAVLQVRERADARKQATARKLLEEFLTGGAKSGNGAGR